MNNIQLFLTKLFKFVDLWGFVWYLTELQEAVEILKYCQFYRATKVFWAAYEDM